MEPMSTATFVCCVTSVYLFNFGSTIVVKQYFIVFISLLSHDGGSYLTESYAVSPTASMQSEACFSFLYIEGRTIEMALAEGTTYLKFLTDSEGFLRTLFFEFLADQLGEFLCRILHGPAIESVGLLIVVVEYLFQYGLIVGVAEGVF